MAKIKWKALIVTGLCLVVSLGLLTACGNKPKNAADLVNRSTEAMKSVESAHVEFDGDVNLSTKMDDSKSNENGNISLPDGMDIPIKASGSFELSKEVVAGSYNASLSILGLTEDMSSEMYVDLKSNPRVTYVRDDGEEMWTKSVADDTEESSEPLSQESIDKARESIDKFLDYAEMSETDNGYRLTVDMTKVEPSELRDLLEDATKNSGEDFDLVMEDMTIKSGTMTADFDGKTFYLTVFNIDDLETESIFEDEYSGSGTYSIKMNLHIKGSDYNAVAKDALVIPNEVKENAVDSDDAMFDSGDSDDAFGFGDESLIPDGDSEDSEGFEFEPGPGVTVIEEPEE